MAIGWKTEETKTTSKEWWLQTQWSNIGATPSAGNHPTTREDLLAACEVEGLVVLHDPCVKCSRANAKFGNLCPSCEALERGDHPPPGDRVGDTCDETTAPAMAGAKHVVRLAGELCGVLGVEMGRLEERVDELEKELAEARMKIGPVRNEAVRSALGSWAAKIAGDSRRMTGPAADEMAKLAAEMNEAAKTYGPNKVDGA